MGNICFSTDRVHVEAWYNGTRCTTAAVDVYGVHGAMGICLNYLRQWSGQEPTIDKELKAEMDRIDSLFCELAFAGKYR